MMSTQETPKARQTIYERAEVGERVVHELKALLRKTPVEVIGHLDATGICCGGGTVAIVRVDLDEVQGK